MHSVVSNSVVSIGLLSLLLCRTENQCREDLYIEQEQRASQKKIVISDGGLVLAACESVDDIFCSCSLLPHPSAKEKSLRLLFSWHVMHIGSYRRTSFFFPHCRFKDMPQLSQRSFVIHLLKGPYFDEQQTIRKIVASALNEQSIHKVAFDPDTRIDLSNMRIKTDEVDVVDQKGTGTCWLQAGVTYLSARAKKEKSVSVRFSVPYLHFYDKIEKARVFLEAVKSKKLEERELWHWLHDGPVQDGGTWGMFQHLITKYGLVPHCQYRPTYQAMYSSQLNTYINSYLRSCLPRVQEGSHRVDQIIEEIMLNVQEALLRCYSTPPEEVALNVYEHKLDACLPPKEIMSKLCLDCESVVLCHAPDREEGVYCGPYSNDHSNPKQDLFYCVNMQKIKGACVAQLEGGTPVWFTSEIKYDFSSRRAIGKVGMYKIEEFLMIGPHDKRDKAQRMRNKNTSPCHAMLLTAVNTSEEGDPLTWRVQNSWGKASEYGKGFVTVGNDWFEEHVFQVAVHKEYTEDLPTTDPKYLTQWDIFATVAT